MNDPLSHQLAERVAAATPAALPPFEEIQNLSRRRRMRSTLMVLGSAAMVAGVTFGGWALLDPSPAPNPDLPLTSPSPSETSAPALPTTDPRLDPNQAGSDVMSGIVIQLPDRNLRLPADTSCWRGPKNCFRGLGLSHETLPDLGSHDAINFSFPRPGWTFSATFRSREDACPHATTVEAVATGDRTFRLTPGDAAGSYLVELYGSGPEGLASGSFTWTTTTDGPVDPAEGAVALFPESGGEGSYALEVTIDDLAFHPAELELSRTARAVITAADGTRTNLNAPLRPTSLSCGPRGNAGTFYFQKEWFEDPSALGPAPFTYAVTLMIRDTTYTGTATAPRDHIEGREPYARLVFDPPLPAAHTD